MIQGAVTALPERTLRQRDIHPVAGRGQRRFRTSGESSAQPWSLPSASELSTAVWGLVSRRCKFGRLNQCLTLVLPTRLIEGFFPENISHETHLSAFSRAPQAHPRVSRPDGYPRRAGRAQCTPPQGPGTPRGLSTRLKRVPTGLRLALHPAGRSGGQVACCQQPLSGHPYSRHARPPASPARRARLSQCARQPSSLVYHRFVDSCALRTWAADRRTGLHRRAARAETGGRSKSFQTPDSWQVPRTPQYPARSAGCDQAARYAGCRGRSGSTRGL